MRAVFTARLVWLVMEISDNSREMENYDQPESHALCHHNLFQDCGLDLCLSLPNLSFSFNAVTKVRPQRAARRTERDRNNRLRAHGPAAASH